ncbi:MAG: AAA family ATPase [Lachnospiraceae bacterium]|nr:AAA family ATPase [Lachnospiraceae bacterium]
MNQKITDGSFSIRGFVMEVLSNFWMVIFAGAIAYLGLTGISGLVEDPLYESKATMVISSKESYSSITSLQTASQMAAVFSEVFQSESLKENIIQDVGEEMEGDITCRQIESTNLLSLTAVSGNPRHAYLMLCSAIDNYGAVSGYVFGQANLLVLTPPDVPTEPMKQATLLTYRKYLIPAAMLFMIFIIALLYLFRFTVKTTRGARKQLDGNVLGTIPYEKPSLKRRRKGAAKHLIGGASSTMAFSESVRRAAQAIQQHMERKEAKVLLVTSAIPNEGKTMTAANIAISLAEKKAKVLLIDGDFLNPSMETMFEKREDAGTISDVIAGVRKLGEAVSYDRKYRFFKLYQDDGGRGRTAAGDHGKIESILETCRREMDYVIVDSSPITVSADAEMWMGLADTAVLVVRQDWADVRVINDAVDMIWQNTGDFGGFVLNAFEPEWGDSSGSQSYGYERYA